ncbi:hypothetical protein FKW77_001759 [Venturia effusa]|uniref:Peptidase A1 domain-containing protein n=1 Tax=Venturia effusa TaxID=50376 RepID=A0A517LBX1_9PEZI|nr:hypothetical protein FKW77_001759 [Venturia effusa]
MHSLQAILLTVSLLAADTIAAPHIQKRSFVHHVKRSINRRDPTVGPNAMLKAYAKYGFTTVGRANNSTAAPAAAGEGGGTVGAIPEANAAEYLSPVNIGGQTVTLDFDTGSSDLWVFSSALSKQTIGQHSAFDPAQSKTFQPMQGATWSISYGDGSGAAGTVGMDVVNIGGATATRQAVELATAVSQSFAKDTNNDGLVGLAFSQLNTIKPTKQTTFFDSVMPQLAMPVFSVDLKNDSTGTYQFGAIDMTKAQGPLTTIPVNAASGFWQVDSPSVTIGNSKVANQGGSPAIADTGTSLLLVDPQVANAYYAKVQGATNDAQVGGFTYPCNAQLPDFGVAMGPSYTAMVPGNAITFAQVDANTCFGGVQSNGGANLQIYGDVMFRTQYVVFDGKNKALMMAPKA